MLELLDMPFFTFCTPEHGYLSAMPCNLCGTVLYFMQSIGGHLQDLRVDKDFYGFYLLLCIVSTRLIPEEERNVYSVILQNSRVSLFLFNA